MTMQNYRNLPGGTVTRLRQARRDRTEAEDRLWYALRDRLPQHKWRFQVPFYPYHADFACLNAKLIIEVDGGQHDKQRTYDERRTRHLQALGYHVLRFWNHEVLGNTDGVLQAIATALSLSYRDQGRSLVHRTRPRAALMEGAAKRRKGEGDQDTAPSPDLASLGHPLPMGEGK
jgi:very-short-patch-repair endonuclease